MRFTIVGHAGLYVESGETDLVVDPWLFGSCYWRSWWPFPPLDEIDPKWLTPRYIYISHHHFDHFHYPSLRRIHRDAHILVPRFGVDVMRRELASLGFDKVTEMPHGKPMDIGDGVTLRSYQYGVDDSTLMVTHGDTVIADLNDCKVRGWALRHMLSQTGPPTFLLKNYSAAQAYPGCYRAERAEDLQMISRNSYIVDFMQLTADSAPRYAVPFASMACFLHPETTARNAEIISPHDLEAAFETSPVAGAELVVMTPGDSWDEQAGFALSRKDPFEQRDATLARLQARAQPSVDASLAEEATRRLTFERFARYMGRFVTSLPPGLPRLFKRPVVFLGPDDAEPYWVIDIRARRVYASSALPKDWASLVRVPSGVLVDGMSKKIVNFIHISMRLEIELNAGGVGTDFMFWGLLTVWELGYFPVRSLSMVRVGSAAWSRRREFLGMAWSQVSGQGSPAERMATTLMPSRTEAAG